MSDIEHDLSGTLLGVSFDRVTRVFQEAGYRAKSPRSDELTIRGDDVDLDIYRSHGALSETEGRCLLSGALLCAVDRLEDLVQELARLFSAADVIYHLEYEPDGEGRETVVSHPDFARPETLTLEKEMVFEVGSAYAPDAPFGLSRLRIRVDGSFVYENLFGATVKLRRSGHLTVGAHASLAAEVLASRFPSVPEQEMPPGPRYLTITTAAGQRAMINLDAAKKFVGYGHIADRVLEWTQYLRTNANLDDAPSALVVDA